MPAEARAGRARDRIRRPIRTEIEDGYAALRALLPPPERRGLVLIDPPYESPEELKRCWRRSAMLTAAGRAAFI